MYLRHLEIEPIFQRYQVIASRLPVRFKSLALVLAPWQMSAIVLFAGVLGIGGSVVVTGAIGRSGEGGFIAVVLVLAFLAECVGAWVKERYETLLTVTVRQLVYRRFRALARSDDSEGRGDVLTFPGQISQYAYVIDFVVSSVRILAILTVSFVMYGANGVLAALLIAGLVVVSVILIGRIGVLWEQYVQLEGRRREWIERLARFLPRSRFFPNWGYAVEQLTDARLAEEELLVKRMRLQVLSGFLDRGALTAVLAVVALAGVWLWPGSSFGIGAILGARYLFEAVQNNLVNYRVIRLSLPMMRSLDERESRVRPVSVVKAPSWPDEMVVPGESGRAESLRRYAAGSGSCYVPSNPELFPDVLKEWRAVASPVQAHRFETFARSVLLSDSALQRLWTDPSTLSSGERHRAALALVVADDPEELILDDTFASLDPETRELAGVETLKAVPKCTLLSGSDEYVPRSFRGASGLCGAPVTVASSALDSSALGMSSLELPDPSPQRATFLRSLGLVFGSWTILIVMGAALLALGQIQLALSAAAAESQGGNVGYVAVFALLASVLGSLLFFVPIFWSPIRRLGSLHGRIAKRFQLIARPGNRGAVLGRLGEDFSELQMSVPGALGSVFFTLVNTVLIVLVAVIGAPAYLCVVVAVIPLSVLALRLSSPRVQSATTVNANIRGVFLGAVSTQAALGVAVSPTLQVAGGRAYESAERAYMDTCVAAANAFAFRTALIQGLVLLLSIPAVLLPITGFLSATVQPAAVVYFAVALGAGVQATIETFQRVGVVGLTVERVRMLEEYAVVEHQPPFRKDVVDQIDRLLDEGHTLIAVIGASGSGKSLALDAMYARRTRAVVLPEMNPFAEIPTMVDLAECAVRDSTYQLVMLDETLRPLSIEAEREMLGNLKKMAKAEQKQMVVSLHSRKNLDLADRVVCLDEQ